MFPEAVDGDRAGALSGAPTAGSATSRQLLPRNHGGRCGLLTLPARRLSSGPGRGPPTQADRASYCLRPGVILPVTSRNASLPPAWKTEGTNRLALPAAACRGWLPTSPVPQRAACRGWLPTSPIPQGAASGRGRLTRRHLGVPAVTCWDGAVPVRLVRPVRRIGTNAWRTGTAFVPVDIWQLCPRNNPRAILRNYLAAFSGTQSKK
jgi:hypothetical protein